MPASKNGRPGRADRVEPTKARDLAQVALLQETSQHRHPFTPYQHQSLLTHSSPTSSCLHIVIPQPLVHVQQEDPIKRRSSLFPRTKRRNPYQYPSAVRESPDVREWKEKYSKYQMRHPSRLKSRNWKAYDDNVTSSSRHVLLIAA